MECSMDYRYTRQDLTIAVNGIRLAGWFYRPDTPQPSALVVMSPGFAAVKEQYLDRFAESFAAAGLAVVVYDQRNFGASGGDLRGDIDPHQQIEDMREVITWASAQAEIDPQRIGVWGSSYSGGHAICLGALDKRVRCVVAQVPTISGHQSFLRRAGEQIHAVRDAFQRDRAARYRGEPAIYRRVIAEAGEAGIYPGDDAQAFYGAARTLAQGWENRVTLRSSERASEYEPGMLIERLSPTPLLMLVAERDTVTPADLALAAYTRAGEPKRLCLLPDGHFDPYTRHAQQAISVARDWFVQHLQVQ
ncbi:MULTISPECIES: alpha/beta hydrolase [Pseudomonas]|nr:MULTISPECIES: alpha/beta hydrolase [Pseudomonas]MDD1976171.1 alpha/beta hydrolase [Pseudomonas putida]MDH2562074.1 alpha/beta hydrolase [Pseudomonas sp. Hg5Tf]